MRIIRIPIENIPMRYSADWNEWFPREFGKLGVENMSMYPGELVRKKDTIQRGVFLDVCFTNYFKSFQMVQIAHDLSEGRFTDEDVFFFDDLWNPAVEMLAYMRDCLDMRFKIVGILHAGTWDPKDFLSRQGLGNWAKYSEMSWLKIVDAVFVATEFHKGLIINYFNHNFGQICNKIHVTGLPIFPPSVFLKSWKDRFFSVVFPHRLDPEKQPEKFDQIKEYLKGTPFKMAKTFESCNTKDSYYSRLSESKISVSFALQETWGIAMIESVLCGCIPLVPDRLSYSELYPDWAFYQDESHLESLIDWILNNNQVPWESEMEKLRNKFILMGQQAIPNMLKIIYSL